MRHPHTSLSLILLVLTLLVILTDGSTAQILHRQTGHSPAKAAKTQPEPTFGYVTRPLFLPSPAMGGPVLPPGQPPKSYTYPLRSLSYVNPVFIEDVHFDAGAINDNGDAAFAFTWSKRTHYNHGGVYTEKRKVASIGQVIDGQRIVSISSVQINNSGVVAYRAEVRSNARPDTRFDVFVENRLAISESSAFDTRNYILGENGIVYAFSASSLDSTPSLGPEEPGYVTMDGVTIYKLAGTPPSYDTRLKDCPVITLPPDVAQRIISSALIRSLRDQAPGKYQAIITFYRADGTPAYTEKVADPLKALFPQPLPWGSDSSAVGPLGGQMTDLQNNITVPRTIWLNLQGKPVITDLPNPKTLTKTEQLWGVSGLIGYASYYVGGINSWPEEVCDGLSFTSVDGASSQPLGNPLAMNRKGQILLSAWPLPDSHQVFEYAIATPTLALGVPFSTVLTQEFRVETKP